MFDIIEKMDPMARKALAAIEAIQKAIKENDTESIAHQILNAENALSMLKSDLHLHDQLQKSMNKAGKNLKIGYYYVKPRTALGKKDTEWIKELKNVQV